MLKSVDILLWHLICVYTFCHGVHRPFVEYETIIYSVSAFVKYFYEKIFRHTKTGSIVILPVAHYINACFLRTEVITLPRIVK